MKELALFFDKLKISNPLLYAIIVSILIGLNALINEFIQLNYFDAPWDSVIKIIDQVILLLLGVLGTRTYKYIHNETNVQQ